MNIRITKLYQGSAYSTLEIAFNSCAEGRQLVDEIARATGLHFHRPAANRFALRELHLAEIGDEDDLQKAFVKAFEIAQNYGEVHDSQTNMKGPGELPPDVLGRAAR